MYIQRAQYIKADHYIYIPPPQHRLNSHDIFSPPVKRSTGYTHTPTKNNTPDTDTHTHTHDMNNTPNPQTNIPHKHLTTLEGGTI